MGEEHRKIANVCSGGAGRDFSNMLDYLFQLTNATEKELCNGICTESYFSRSKNSLQEMNAVVYVNILKRMYISPDRFRILIDTDEYQYFLWVEECQEYIRKGLYEELYQKMSSENAEVRFPKYAKIVGHDAAFFRFVAAKEWLKDNERAYREITKSIDYMLDADQNYHPGRYCAEEYNRFLNYLKTASALGKMTREKLALNLHLMTEKLFLENRDPREAARVLPRFFCFARRILPDLFDADTWEEHFRNCLNRLQKTWQLNDLPELLRQLIEIKKNTKPGDASPSMEKWLWALAIAYGTAEYSLDFSPYDSHDNAFQLFLIHEYLKRGRQNAKDEFGKQYTQYTLSEGILEENGYARNERGKTRPTPANFKALTIKMGVSSKVHLGDIETAFPEDYSLITDIRIGINQKNADQVQYGLRLLNKHLDKSRHVNAQFLAQISASLQYMKKEISGEEYINQLIKALEITKHYSEDSLYVYSPNEIEIIYKIVRNKRMLGIMTEEDVRILQSVLDSEATSSYESWEKISLSKRLMAGILHVAGKFRESEKLSLECLHEMIKCQDASVLVDCLDILSESIMHKEKQEAARLMEAAYWISDLYNDQLCLPAVKNMLQDFFGIKV